MNRAAAKKIRGGQRIERNLERTGAARFALPKHDHGQRYHRQKDPEDWSRVRNHRFEAASGDGTERHQEERQGPLKKQGVDWSTALIVPPTEQMKRTEVPAQRVGGPSPGNNGRVGGAERRKRHRTTQKRGSHGSQCSLHEIGGHDARRSNTLETQCVDIGEIGEDIQCRDDANAPQERSRHRTPTIPHFSRDVGRLIPAAVGEKDEDHS